MATTLYHRTLPPRILLTQGEVEALLADGWADTPAAFYDTPPALCGAVHHSGEPTWRCERPQSHRGSHKFREYPEA